METKYFMIINGQQVGPLDRHQLLANGLTPATHVWREGLPDWVLASTLPELADLLAPEEPRRGDYRQPPYGQQPYGQQPPYGYGRQPYNPYDRTNVPHTNWLTWAIIATILGFFCSCIGLVFGIIAIVKANNANKFYAMGDATMGDYYNSGARTWTIVAFVMAGLGLIGSFFYLAFLGSYANLLN